MPDALGAEGAEIRYAINGLLSQTPDGLPVLGETPEVKGLWSAAAVWIKEGPGTARAVAEWMTHGWSEIDVSHSDIARFYPHQRTREHVRSRTSEAFNKTYGIVHPGEQWGGERGKRLSPMNAAEREAGAVFFETAGWERPFWYASNEALLGEYGDAVMPREHEWDARWWSPIINAEHLAMRERAAIFDLTAFAIFDVVGPGAKDAVQGIVVAQADVPDGRVIYTPVLDPHGGFRSDLTVMRLAHDHYRVVTGGAHGMADRKWFADHLPADGRAQIVDVTSAWSTIGLWGPRARDILGSLTDADVSDSGFGFLTCRGHPGRQHVGAGLADLLRRRAGLGAVRTDGAGRPPVAAAAGGRPAARRRPGRDRRLRHHRPAGEGLPGLRGRARRRADDRRGRDGAAEGQEGGLRGPRRLPGPARGGTGVGALHADRRQPQHRQRPALHAGRRADPDRERRRR